MGLKTAAWLGGRETGQDAMLAILKVASTMPAHDGVTGWEVFPAAEQALREFYGLCILAADPGREVATTNCVVDPLAACRLHRTVGEFGAEIGTRLFPFGTTEAGAFLLVDEAGRLFSLDHGGRWLWGETVAAGLEALTAGLAPIRVQRRSRRWQLSRAAEDALVADLVKTAMVIVYLLHHHGVLSARALRATVEPLPGLVEPELLGRFPLSKGMEASAEMITRGVATALAERKISTGSARVSLAVPPPDEVKGPSPSVQCSVSAGGSGAGSFLALEVSADKRGTLNPLRDVLDALDQDLDRYGAQRRPPAGTTTPAR